MTMKIRMDKTLRFWVEVAYDHIKPAHDNLTKRQVVAQILRKYEQRGDAMRYLDVEGKIAWKATPRFLTMLGDAERDAQDELEDVS
jgi:ubiquinone biosynthesis protein UbiJ